MFEPMVGDLYIGNAIIQRGGFITPSIPQNGFALSDAGQISRGDIVAQLQGHAARFAEIQRGETVGTIEDIANQLNVALKDIERGLTASEVPIRENLEAPAISLIPQDTPLRNMLPRTPGAGAASLWEQLTSLGGGWGASYDQPGGGSATRIFYAETGAPAEFESVYAQKTAAYKLLGAFGSVTGKAIAAGANYQDQMAQERTNALNNLMLNEENALTRGDSSSTSAPWGDGSNALAFDGLYNLVTTGNGTPSANIQTSVGALTKAHLDNQVTDIWKQGGRDIWMHVNAQEVQSLVTLCEADGSILRVNHVAGQGVVLGFNVTGYMHPIAGMVTILVSRFASAGTIIFGAKYGPDGKPTLDVNVLPQVPVPQQVENPQQIQGYTVTELARTLTAPDVHPFMISVYEVMRMKNALCFGKSTGVTSA